MQYDDGPAPQQTADNYDSQQRDDTVIDCGLDDEGRPLTCPDDQAGYTPDDEMAPADDAPLFAPDYYAYEDYQYHAPYPYYAGVSLWPDYYWPGYAWGWGGWGWMGLACGKHRFRLGLARRLASWMEQLAQRPRLARS